MRTPINKIHGEELRDSIWDELPPYAEKYMEATFQDHDPKAAIALIAAAPNEWRGHIALCAYWIGLPNPAYREIIESVWIHDHPHMVAAAPGGIPEVRQMFAEAEFPIKFSGLVTVYRGVFNVDRRAATEGLAWTTSREIACWFAYKWIRPPEIDSLVLKATVDASEVIFWSNDRKEHEVILRRPPPAEVDEAPERWQEIAARFVEAKSKTMTASGRI